MAASNPALLHGFINNAHTSNLTSFYPPPNLPTPWPLVVASLVFSLVLGCYGVKGAFLSWTEEGQDRRKGLTVGVGQTWLQTFRERYANYRTGIGRPVKGKKRAHPVVHDSELEDLHRPDEVHPHLGLNDDSVSPYEHEHRTNLVQKLNIDDKDYIIKNGELENDGITKNKRNIDDEDENFMYKHKNFDNDMASKHTADDPFGDSEAATLRESVFEVPKNSKWDVKPSKRAITTVICTYCTFRAIVGFIIAIVPLINRTTPPPAPSLLLLIILSIQAHLSNRSIPRLFTLIYTVSATLTSLAFLISSYAPFASSSLPSYGKLTLTGGNCPIPASDCHNQIPHWTVLGCANYTYYYNWQSSHDDVPESLYYPPYATHSDMNLNANPLHLVETVLFVFGTIWLLTVLLNIYEARHLFRTPAIWSNMLRPQGPVPQAPAVGLGRRPGSGRLGAGCTSMVTILGIMGAFVAAIMSLAAHVSQATGVPGHSTTYIDSFGPGTWANFTVDRNGYINGTSFEGNVTDWNDCFTVSAPAVAVGWAEWSDANGGWVWLRIVAGL